VTLRWAAIELACPIQARAPPPLITIDPTEIEGLDAGRRTAA